MAKETTMFAAPVPTAEYEFFKENFPQYGSVTWFINQALVNFNAEVRRDPSVKDKINAAVRQMVDLNRVLGSIDSQ